MVSLAGDNIWKPAAHARMGFGSSKWCFFVFVFLGLLLSNFFFLDDVFQRT
jgi:hypothetical protein